MVLAELRRCAWHEAWLSRVRIATLLLGVVKSVPKGRAYALYLACFLLSVDFGPERMALAKSLFYISSVARWIGGNYLLVYLFNAKQV